MNLRYYSEFKGIYDSSYRIEIYTRREGDAKELTLASEPVFIEYESGELYKSAKMSSAKIGIFTKNILQDMYTGENQGVHVKIYKNGAIFWFGYMTPNLYSSDYITDFDNVELQAIDTIACMENIKYSYVEESGKFRTFTELILNMLDKGDPGRVIPKVFVQKAKRLSKGNTSCILSEMYVHERNFFDEMNEPMTCKQVIEELAKYLGYTVMQYKDAYYLIDYDYTNKGYNDYFSFNRSDRSVESVVLNGKELNVLDIGVARSAGTVSLGDVYNKVSILANMNAIGNVFPSITDDDDLVNQNADPNKYYEDTKSINGENNVLLFAFFKSKYNWNYLKPAAGLIGTETVEEVTKDNLDSIGMGTYWQKVDNYLLENGEPSSLSWKTLLTFCGIDRSTMPLIDINSFLSLKKKEIMMLKGGYLIIDMKFKLSGNKIGNDALTTSSELYSNTKFGAGFSDTLFPCRLSLGGYYYDGDNWISYDSFQKKIENDYYKSVIGPNTFTDAKWFWYIDNKGYKRFISEAEYNALPAGVTKQTGGYSDKNKVYYFFNGGTRIFVTEEYYRESFLKDRFYLVRKNKEGDRVFDEYKSLTNTVSYKMNIDNASDGVAIRMPEEMLLQGEVVFELYAPNQLGTYPMFRTDATYSRCVAFHVSDLKMKHANSKAIYDVFDVQTDSQDTVYENVINEDNVKEMRDYELLVNSNSKNISSYSNTATKIGDNFDYIKQVYSPLTNESVIPEQMLIDRLYNHYKEPKVTYQNELKDVFSPLDRIRENSLNKTMVVDSMRIDCSNESNYVTLIEV